jgi:hypothetical protein
MPGSRALGNTEAAALATFPREVLSELGGFLSTLDTADFEKTRHQPGLGDRRFKLYIGGSMDDAMMAALKAATHDSMARHGPDTYSSAARCMPSLFSVIEQAWVAPINAAGTPRQQNALHAASNMAWSIVSERFSGRYARTHLAVEIASCAKLRATYIAAKRMDFERKAEHSRLAIDLMKTQQQGYRVAAVFNDVFYLYRSGPYRTPALRRG